MTADECEFCFMDYCNPPDNIVKAGWVCPKALPIEEGDITHKCGGNNDELISLEEWEAKQELEEWEAKQEPHP